MPDALSEPLEVATCIGCGARSLDEVTGAIAAARARDVRLSSVVRLAANVEPREGQIEQTRSVLCARARSALDPTGRPVPWPAATSTWVDTARMADEPHPGVVPESDGPRDPERLESAGAPAQADLPAGTRLGPVHLTVSDLPRSLDYYAAVLGLRVRSRDDRSASVGVGDRELLVLVEERGARPAAGSTGLYHFALLVPRRTDLAAWLAHAARDRVALTGMSDHFVSEAVYLSDPDGHGIEIYWDRPRDVWEGLVAARMTTLPLDVDGLLAELEDPRSAPFDGLPAGTTMGHVHLKVASIPETVAFYRDGLGFGVMATLGRQAAFLGAGGYHHHVGANTWESAGASPAPPGTAAMRSATIVLPEAADRDKLLERLERRGQAADLGAADPIVRDPSGNALVLSVDSQRQP